MKKVILFLLALLLLVPVIAKAEQYHVEPDGMRLLTVYEKLTNSAIKSLKMRAIVAGQSHRDLNHIVVKSGFNERQLKAMCKVTAYNKVARNYASKLPNQVQYNLRGECLTVKIYVNLKGGN